jgi:hypothetical protein
MAEQFLSDAQIRAVLQKMAREGMAEHMRAHARGADSRGGGAGLEIAGKSLAREVPSRAIGRKQPMASRPGIRFLLKCAVGRNRPPRLAR